MSVATAVARMSELQSLLGIAQTGVPPATAAAASPAVKPASFKAQLAAAQGPQSSTGGLAAPGEVASGTGPVNGRFSAEINAAAKKYRLDPAVLKGLIKQESNFNPNAGSPAGARGLAQLMPGTARGLGVTNVLDPQQSINGGAKYLRQMLDQFGGDIRKALAAYNAGPGAVQKYKGIPPYAETQNYVKKVLGYAETFRGEAKPDVAPAKAGRGGGLPYRTV